MLEQKGAAVVLCSDTKTFSACSRVLLGGTCPDWVDWVGKDAQVFSAVGEEATSDRLICCFEPECPHQLQSQIPEGVPPSELCSALYQFAACRRLAQLMPKTCRIGGMTVKIEELGLPGGQKAQT
jgi:hypothetical protein